MKDCTIYKTADIIGKKWTLLIFLELHKGQNGFKRFNELKKKLNGITHKILSYRLKELEEKGLVERRVDDSTSPIISEYRLTDSAKDFIPIIQQIKKWGLKWKVNNKECESTMCKNCSI